MAQSDWLKDVTIREFGCIKQLVLTLTPLHAFVGPNDSGKSTVLDALYSVSRLLANQPPDGSPKSRAGTSFRAATRAGNLAFWEGAQRQVGSIHGRPALKLRLDPDALRAPSPLISVDSPIEFGDARGRGLSSVYDAILTRHLDRFLEIREQLRHRFPTVADLNVPAIQANLKMLQVKLRDGQLVRADQMSEGMLYWLAFAAVPMFDDTAPILIEEPENGLHPARIQDVMRMLRELSASRQVLLSTHSPLVVNELDGSEVTVLTRPVTAGTQGVLLKDTPSYAQRAKHFQNGELWLQYCDGILEAPLLDPAAETKSA